VTDPYPQNHGLAALEEIAADNPGAVSGTTLEYWQDAVSSTHPQ
jgi:hypothetical protein